MGRLRRIFIAAFVLAGLVPAAHAAVEMISPVAATSAGAMPKSLKAALPVRFNADAVFGVAPGTTVDVALPNGNRQAYVFERVIDHGGGIRTWIGKSAVIDGGHRAVITSSPAGTWGWMSSQYGHFRLYPGEAGTDWLAQSQRIDLAPKKGGSDAVPGPIDLGGPGASYGVPTMIHGFTQGSSLAKAQPTPIAQVDLMFIYTKDLAQKLGAGLMPMMFNVVASANQAYIDSDVGFSLRLVNATMLDVSNASASEDVLDGMAGGSTVTALNNLFQPLTWGSGALRDQVGADVVALIRDGPTDTGGIGDLLKPSSPLSAPAARAYSVSNFCVQGCEGIVTHEIGHNMGDHHDRATIFYDSQTLPASLDDSGVFPYSYGMYSCNGVNTGFAALTCDPSVRPFGSGGSACPVGQRPSCATAPPHTNDFGTVMAYFYPQTLRFSNPLQNNCVAAAGTAPASCGVTNQDDNARSMNNVRQNVSAYRTATIAGDVTGLPGSLQFDQMGYSGTESGGSLVLHVTRTSGSKGAVSVQYTINAGTATAGADYTGTSGTLNWADGDAATKNITVPLVNDQAVEGVESFTVTLSNASGATGVYLGYPITATALITEAWPSGTVGTLPTGFANASGSSVTWAISNDSSADGDGVSLRSGAIDFSVANRHCTDPTYGSVPCPSAMQYVGTFAAGPLAFAYRVSAFPGNGFLEFFVDGTLVLTAGGSSANTNADSGWQFFSTTLTAGAHTLKWQYRPVFFFACAGASSGGPPPYPGCADRAWIDELSLPLPLATSTTTLGTSLNPITIGQSVTFTATVSGSSGTPTGTAMFYAGGTLLGCSPVTLSAGSAACTTSALSFGSNSIQAVYSGSTTYATSTSTTLAETVNAGPQLLSASLSNLDFGGQSMNTTAPTVSVVFTNNTASSVTPTSVTVPAGYAIVSDGCTGVTVAASATCTVSLNFTPGAQGTDAGYLLVFYAGGGPTFVPLTGVGEHSLVTHYYQSILRRNPDSGGKAFWEGEATRVSGLGANINETWYAMAMSFYASAEYAAFNRDDTGYVTDLYNTFFNRAPDAAGLTFWTGQLASGMPREVLLAQYMFSTEFANFTQAIFGNTTARAEVNMAVDFYRVLLSRLPDSGGLTFWVGQFQTAQCQGSAQVIAQVNSISSAFITSAEYTARNRTNAQYVGDLYNAFLRRGGDLAGVQFWIGQLATNAQSREQLRQQFVASTEFQNRVTAVLAQGCTH
jgi:hypothetical protein